MQVTEKGYLQDKKFNSEKLFLDFVKVLAVFMNVYNMRKFIRYSSFSVHLFNSSRSSPKKTPILNNFP